MIKINLKKLLVIGIALVVALVAFQSFPRFVYPLKYEKYIFKYSQKNNLDPYLVCAVIKAESNFNPNATSNKDAKGLMQITDTTGKWGAEKLNISFDNKDYLYDPEINIEIGTWYLRNLLKEFKGDVSLAIAAYNGGSGNVQKWLKDKKLSKTGERLDTIPFKETKNYIKRVYGYYDEYKRLYNPNKSFLETISIFNK